MARRGEEEKKDNKVTLTLAPLRFQLAGGLSHFPGACMPGGAGHVAPVPGSGTSTRLHRR